MSQAYHLQQYLERFLAWLSPLKKDPPGLLEAAEDARRTWKLALDYLNHIDSSMLDYAIHNINACERHYMALLQMARKEGATAWPASIFEPVYEPAPVPGQSRVNDRAAGPREAVHH